MLDIFNKLKPFFENSYLEVGVREFSRMIGISPPMGSIFLKKMQGESFLLSRYEKRQLLFRANRESKVFLDLSRIYWEIQLKDLIDFIEDHLYPEVIILFGSLIKLEVNLDSDIDLFIISKHKKDLDFSRFEKKLKRNVQVFSEESISKLPRELKKNVLNGFILGGNI